MTSQTAPAPIMAVKNTIFQKDPGCLLGDTLSSKLASLTFQSVISNMTTPPALSTPTSKYPDPDLIIPPQKYDGFSLRSIKLEDKERVLDFLRTFFFIDEPLNVSLKLLDGPDDRCEELEHFCVKPLYQNASVMAYNEKGEIIGVMIGEIVFRDQPEDGTVYRHEKFKKIIDLMENCENQANVFDVLPEINNLIDMKILSVDNSYRNKGVGGALANRLNEIGKALKIDIIKVICSSHFTSRITQKFGFDRIFTQNYADYKVDGNVVFTPADPHKALTIDVKKI